MTTTTVRFASPKQVNFIMKLSSERGVSTTREHVESLSMRAASYEIDRLLALPRVATTTTTTATDRPTLTDGRVYVNDAGEFVLITLSRAGRQYGKLITHHGLIYRAGLITADLRPPTAEEAKAYGDRYGACVFCRTAIGTGEERGSIDAGYGPDCASRYGLPWTSRKDPSFA